MSSIYIDVTQLAVWQGKLTGIPRVMHELSIRFKEKADTKFVVWDEANQMFRIIQEKDFLEQPSKQNSFAEIKVEKKSLKRRAAKKLIPGKVRIKLRKIVSSQANIKWTGQKVALLEADILFVLWGEWGSQNYINSLLEVKHAGVRLVQIAYDMLPIITPQFSGHSTESLKNYVSSVYPVCNLIFAISKNTKADIETWLGENNLNIPEVRVFRLGDDFSYAKPIRPKQEFLAEKQDFLLMVGTIEARKNHALIYFVYKLAKQRGIELPKLVIVGRRGWNTENIYELMTLDPETKDQFVFLHDASDEELSWLYENCLFSVYPSLYEGWGLPISESLSRGVPCVASNTSSMPEISDNGVLFFSPASTDECLNAINSLLSKTELVKLRKDAKRYNLVSWDISYKAVERALEVIK